VKVAFLRAWLDQLERRRGELEREHARLDLVAAAEEKRAGTQVHLVSLQADGAAPHNDRQWLQRKATIAGGGWVVLAVLLVRRLRSSIVRCGFDVRGQAACRWEPCPARGTKKSGRLSRDGRGKAVG